MKLARSTYYYRSRRAAAREKALRERIVAVCAHRPRCKAWSRLTLSYLFLPHIVARLTLTMTVALAEAEQDISDISRDMNNRIVRKSAVTLARDFASFLELKILTISC